ncbi:type IV secretory system conjugative DNA transfer family protein, partial [Acidithiobacillus ferridurans]|uniref:type IV secretory system conjugative DNA transfer family protein n=1 Tax=Acidithiobacillus ferridurans TaxID=1232575 RepID=UPI001C07D3FA
TAGVLRPALRQVFDYKPTDETEKPAGLIMDYKASLVPPVREEAEKVGRSADLLLIGPAHPETRWNPIHAPELEARVLAGRIMAVLENMSGQSGKGDTAWITDNAARLAEHSINLIREATGYVTLQDLHELISGLSSALDNAESADVAPADAAAAFLAPYDRLFRIEQKDGTQYNHSRKYLVQEFAGIESRYRQIYTNELQRVTQYFVDPKYAAIYSPREEEITYPGGAEAIDRGLISILDATVDKYGSLAKILGIFLKLDFMRAAIARPQKHRDKPDYNFSRLLLWMCDEYQEFATTGEHGDDSFYAVCRESKVFSIVATQSKASIERLLGEDKTKVLLASLRTKVFLALSDPSDAKWASDICGDDWQDVENTAINESVTGASATAKTGYVGKETTVSQSYSLNRQKVNRFEPVNFRDLPAFAAIVSGFDGAAAKPPALVYLKPYFRPHTETYKKFREVK